MAVVRITKQVTWEIDAEIKRQFDTRRQPLIAQAKALLDGQDDQLRNTIAACIREEMNVTEQQLLAVDPFLHKAIQLYINKLNDVPVPRYCVPIRFTKAVPVPLNKVTWEGLKSPRLAGIATTLMTINAKCEGIDEEEKKFRSQVMSLLESCSTYRQALEHWPQLKSVTPDHVWRRHEEVRDRVKADVVVPTLDIDQLNTSAVKNVLAKATEGSRL